LYYYRARYYDPAIARFLSADNIFLSDGPNFYAYVSNSPAQFRDPTGHHLLAGILGGAEVGSIAGPPGTVIGGIVGGIIGLYVGQALWDHVVKPLLTEEQGAKEGSKRNSPDQQAVIDLAKEAQKKGGLSADEARALQDLAKDAGVRTRGPESHKDRPQGQNPHIHVGPVDHIWICPVKK
jgi:uncharacterized protein RhaS with RHS repeats